MQTLDLVGFLLPPVIDLINRKIDNSDIRFWMSVLICALVGVLITWAAGNIGDINAVINSIFVVFGLAQISYKAVYESSRLQTKVRK